MSAAEMPAGAAPERAPDWHSIEWKNVWRTVRRLQARIVKAVAEDRWNKVKALVYLLTHSFSGRALAILRVVSNSGAKTPGVDGTLWNTPEAKSAAFSALRRHGYQPQPLRRVYIPKSNGKLRGLGIPTMTDRAMQALYLLGLDPIAESQADGHSSGFRRERRCADALKQVHILLSHRHGPQGILEGDIKACFDRISHDWLLTHVPMDQTLLRQWLKAGFLEKQAWFATTEGTPQGGTVSPVLANWTLDGLQRLLAEHFANTPQGQGKSKVHTPKRSWESKHRPLASRLRSKDSRAVLRGADEKGRSRLPVAAVALRAHEPRHKPIPRQPPTLPQVTVLRGRGGSNTSLLLPRQQRRSYTNPTRQRGIRCVSLAGASG